MPLSFAHRTTAHTRRLAMLLCSTALVMLPHGAFGGPQNGQVVGGTAAISQPTPQQTTVTQQSQKILINWQSFNIGTDDTVTFTQPNSAAIALNRVTGADPSQIRGHLNANGQVWLVNPNGIVFGSSAKVDVAGLLATTLDIANDDFMAGRYRFAQTGARGATIVNAGHISIRNAGLAALVAPGVENSGVIVAHYGRVELLGATAFTLDFYGDGEINFLANGQVANALQSAATAQSGNVLMTANAAKSVVDNVIDLNGYVQADDATVSNGILTLIGPATGAVTVSGTVDVSGVAGRGGQIEVTGGDVHLASTATLDASGATGGGTVLVGGDLHGQGSLANAMTTQVDAGAVIRVDATVAGNAGTAVVWSDDDTTFSGSILATGGDAGGNGGSVEVSGKQTLDFTGTVDTRATAGQAGSLLLDPENVTIAATGETPTLPASGDTSFNPAGDDSILSVTTLQNALALGNVTVTTGSSGSQAGDITVATNVTWANGSSLTLSAYRNIVVDNGVTIANTGAGSLSLRADSTGTGVGTVNFTTSGKVDFSQSTGAVSIFYNPASNPSGSVVNATSYSSPADFSPSVLTNSTVSGQLSAYMLVNTAYDLQDIQNNLGASYAIGKDIDASTTATWNNGAGFQPIGGNQADFTGIFDGESHTISDLSIFDSTNHYYAAQQYTDGSAGLFGISYGVIRNVNLVDEAVNSNVSNLYDLIVGGLVGSNFGTVSNSSVSGTVASTTANLLGGLVGEDGTGGTITNSSSSAAVSGGEITGGLVGDNAALITLSHATGNVTGITAVGGLAGTNNGTLLLAYATGQVTSPDNSESGGLVGINDGNGHASISQSYATGSISIGANSRAGGIAGMSDGIITDTYFVGSISAGDNSDVGGLIGYSGSGAEPSPGQGNTSLSYSVASVTPGNFSNGGVAGAVFYGFGGDATTTYWDAQTSGATYNIATGNDYASLTTNGLTTVQLKSGLPAGFDPTVWAIDANVNDGYPYLIANKPSSAVVTPTPVTPIQVTFGAPILPPPPPPPPPPVTFGITTLSSGGIEIDITATAAQTSQLSAVATQCASGCDATSLHSQIDSAISGLGMLNTNVLTSGTFTVTSSVDAGVFKLIVQPVLVLPPPPPPPPPSGPAYFSLTSLSSGGLEIDISQTASQIPQLTAIASQCSTGCAAENLHTEIDTALTNVAMLQPFVLSSGIFSVSSSISGGIIKMIIQPISTSIASAPSGSNDAAIGAALNQLQLEVNALQTSVVQYVESKNGGNTRPEPPILSAPISSAGGSMAVGSNSPPTNSKVHPLTPSPSSQDRYMPGNDHEGIPVNLWSDNCHGRSCTNGELAGAALQYAFLADAAYNNPSSVPITTGQWTHPLGADTWQSFLTNAMISNGYSSDKALSTVQAMQNSGFSASIYKNGTQYVVAYTGTQLLTDPQDAVQDLEQLTFGPMASVQYEGAVLLARYASQAYGNIGSIVLTGHSLGGGLAQYAASTLQNSVKAITFNAAGIGGILSPLNNPGTYSNIVNVVIDGDPVSKVGYQLGARTLSIDNPEPITSKDSQLGQAALTHGVWSTGSTGPMSFVINALNIEWAKELFAKK